MAKRQVQEINAGSMADIAFLLLIFFLVTTTMSTNTGMHRTLPKMPDGQEETKIDMLTRNVMIVLINKDDQIAVGNTLTDVSVLYDKARVFFTNPANDPNLPLKKEKDIPLIGLYMVTQGVISLQNDRGTSYEKYMQVQNELVRAVNDLRNELSKARFGMVYEELSEDQQKAVSTAVPLAISEAEPRAITK